MKIALYSLFIIAIIVLVFVQSCKQPTENSQKSKSNLEELQTSKTPAWSKDDIIYEVNVRQYTPEGTFNAFSDHLPRLKELGVDILWLMPIHPIGVKNRKGTLGSYYSVQDYKAVNPEFGTMEDFKAFVSQAHEMGFKVILDWVANHTSWDNPWITDHPDWYTRDSLGKMIAPFDWTDVAELDYTKQEMRDAMIDALKFWVVEADIDGYRCDVAMEVPTDFWENAREELDKIKPVFMLAEAEQPDHHKKAFDMSYAWELHHIFNQVAKGEKTVKALKKYFKKNDTVFPKDAYRMSFITNHDENSWNGTVQERMGDGGDAFAVLSYTLPGMPLIYSGQEVANSKRLEFFEKDEINWDLESPKLDFYAELGKLKKENESLWNGQHGGIIKFYKTSSDSVLVFSREKDTNTVLVIANMSNSGINTTIKPNKLKGEFKNFFTKNVIEISGDIKIDLNPWEFNVFIKQ